MRTQALSCQERLHHKASRLRLWDISVATHLGMPSTLTVPAVPCLLRCDCWLEICIAPRTEITFRARRLESQPSIDSLQQRWSYGFDGSRFMYILVIDIFLLSRGLRDHAGFLARDRHCSCAPGGPLALRSAAHREGAALRSCTMRRLPL